jgi:hypothetical protein
MRQRAQPSPATKSGSIRQQQRDSTSNATTSLLTPLPQRRHIRSNSRDENNNIGSGSWEISDHVALTIDEPDHETIDLYHQPYQPPPRSYPQHQSMLQQQQYQNAGGSSLMTEEKLRRFNEQTKSGSSGIYAKSPSSSDALTNWKLDQQYKYRLEDFHTVFRTPHHVPDSRYEAYLLGQTGRRKNDTSQSIVNKECCAQTCAGFSAIAVGFLLFIGILLDTQPLYIPGTLPELVVQSTVNYKSGSDGTVKSYTRPVIQYLVPGPTDERLPAASTAYKAAAAYFLTMILSLYILDPTRFHQAARVISHRLFRKTYEDIPESVGFDDNGSMLPTVHRAKSFSGSGDLTERAASYQPGLWNRTTGTVKRWLAVRGWYRARKFRKYAQKKKG